MRVRPNIRVFYGASIQGGRQKSKFNGTIIDFLRSTGADVVSEHSRGEDKLEVRTLLAKAVGVDEKDLTRAMIRQQCIGWCEGELDAAIFEVSVPSLGAGIELTHCYLRPRLGLKKIPILCLYEKDFWTEKLSSMISGVSKDENLFKIAEYKTIEEAKKSILEFLSSV